MYVQRDVSSNSLISLHWQPGLICWPLWYTISPNWAVTAGDSQGKPLVTQVTWGYPPGGVLGIPPSDCCWEMLVCIEVNSGKGDFTLGLDCHCAVRFFCPCTVEKFHPPSPFTFVYGSSVQVGTEAGTLVGPPRGTGVGCLMHSHMFAP